MWNPGNTSYAVECVCRNGNDSPISIRMVDKKKRRQKANAESLLKEIVSSITDSSVVAFFVR